MKVEYINAFLEPALTILKESTRMDITVGKVSVKERLDSFKSSVIIGISGDIRGAVIMNFTKENEMPACSNCLKN